MELQENDTTVESLLLERGSEYGMAWRDTGLMIAPVMGRFVDFCYKEPGMIYNWITILCKLVRILASPCKMDSWRDIAGYAMLVVKELEQKSSMQGTVEYHIKKEPVVLKGVKDGLPGERDLH